MESIRLLENQLKGKIFHRIYFLDFDTKSRNLIQQNSLNKRLNYTKKIAPPQK